MSSFTKFSVTQTWQINSQNKMERNKEENIKMYENEEERQKQISQDHHLRSCPGDVEIPNRVFVKGFAKDCSEEELKSFFEIYGLVHDAKIVRDNTGISKGYGFVTFDSQEIAEKVKAMGNVMYRDRELVLGPAKLRKKKPVMGIRFRPDQYGWQVPQHHVPCYISPDGVWYFQTMPVVPSFPPTHYQFEPYTPPYSPNCYPDSAPTSPTWPVAPQMQVQMQAQPVANPPPQPPQQPLPPPPQNAPLISHESHTVYNHANSTATPVTFTTYPINVNTLTPANEQYFKLQKSSADKMELQTAMACTSSVHCVPVHYDGSFISTEESVIPAESVHHPNIVYFDSSKMKTVVLNEMPKHIHVV